tara:strand:- start:18125 stop:18631 length:507 start_codon:yes stop_codon:yes gene_type:complete
MIMVINNFFTDEQCAFWRSYCSFASNNDSLEVALKVQEVPQKVDRNYYTLLSKYNFMDEVKYLAEKNFKKKLYFQKRNYGHIMHYHTPGQGLRWHAEPNISTVSVSINISEEYEGAELQFRQEDLQLPYKSAVFYDSNLAHRVSPLTSGEKMSIVMWLPNKEQLCVDS